jgi:hypothetical protein
MPQPRKTQSPANQEFPAAKNIFSFSLLFSQQTRATGPRGAKQKIRNSGCAPAPCAALQSRFDTASRRASQVISPTPPGDIRTSARLKA